MRNIQDTFCGCKPGSTRFKKPCLLIFYDNHKQNKAKKILHTFVDIAREASCKKIEKEETLFELEPPEFFVSLSQRSDFGKSLSEIKHIIFIAGSLQ